jgi:hypothetical protein
MAGWEDGLKGDPLPWLLDEGTPAVSHLAFRFLIDRPADDAELLAAREAAPIDEPGRPSRWVTLRACTVLKAVDQARRPDR